MNRVANYKAARSEIIWRYSWRQEHELPPDDYECRWLRLRISRARILESEDVVLATSRVRRLKPVKRPDLASRVGIGHGAGALIDGRTALTSPMKGQP